MKRLLLERYLFLSDCTIGRLLLDGAFICNTLEDFDRGLDSDMPEAVIIQRKIHGRTAIPSGFYHVDMYSISPRFKQHTWARQYNGTVPLLLSIKGFSGVRIHPGNRPEDTEGCILPGRYIGGNCISDSQAAYHHLRTILGNDDNVTIDIVRKKAFNG